MVPNSWWLNGVIGLFLISLLPLAGVLMRDHKDVRCAWDGLPVERIYRVRIIESSDTPREFCCLTCAERWLQQRRDQARRILVTDESSGREIAAGDAHYVRSTVVTNPVTGNQRHVFESAEDAARHASAAQGLLLAGPERPFSQHRLSPQTDVLDD